MLLNITFIALLVKLLSNCWFTIVLHNFFLLFLAYVSTRTKPAPQFSILSLSERSAKSEIFIQIRLYLGTSAKPFCQG